MFVLVGAAVGAFLLSWLAGRAVQRLTRGRFEPFLSMARVRSQRAFSTLVVASALYYALPASGLPPEVLFHLRHWDQLVAIGTAGWFLTKLLHVGEELVFRRYPRTPADERIRRTRTQTKVIRQTTVALVVLLTVGLMLLTFRPVRVLGITVIASAGVFGLLVGVTARQVLQMAISSIQIAFSGALHLDDVLVVEGNWGQVEEIELTHVVVRTWDKRRLIIPNTYFTSKLYENWTRFGGTVAGSVDLILDYTADLEQLRDEAQRLLEASTEWDRNDWELQMTDMGTQSVTVRITATAGDGPSAWNLRCKLREGMVGFLRTDHPEWMPRRPKFEA
ncbi:mechanosensitive ion channel domain-containing protein [Micromonospora sp. NPDC023888]|uniref:mechanosensitive ion channel family protein n=1 Tax=Micromonospora sp. NPDC023888 TaxID=3155607 RepID=UPI0033FAADD5